MPMSNEHRKKQDNGDEDDNNNSKKNGDNEAPVKCEHMWPTPADMVALKGKPRSEWIRPEPVAVQDIDCYFGRMPEWYIEEKFLKKPGDFLLSRGHNNKLRLSVKSNEPGNPTVHLPIEFCQTKQIRNDRNFYYRIQGTVLQNRSVLGLIRSYQKSNVNSLKINTKRDLRLLNAILPCQGCRCLKTEYSFMNMQIRDKSEINIGDLICKGERSTVYKAKRYFMKKGLVETKTERPVILKEMDEFSEKVLDDIYRELHIVSTIRHQIGWDTAVCIEAIIVINQPYSIAYSLCKKGSLLHYLEKNNVDMNTRVSILQDLACTLHHCQKIPIIHGNLRAKNVFVDILDENSAKPVYYIGGFQHAVMAKTKKVDPEKLPNKRWLAPEIFTTKQLTPETDVFAFAFLMYEVFTLQVPHSKIKKTPDVIDYIRKNPNVRPSVPSTVPNWLRELINDAWSVNPDKRPKMSDIWREFKKKNKR